MLPGPFAEGNAQADVLTRGASLVISSVEQARASHAPHHPNASGLRKRSNTTREAARRIGKERQNCPEPVPLAPQYGVNPRGLLPGHIWQTDVTPIAEFGRQSFVHVTVATYSGSLVASAHPGENTRRVICRVLSCFAISGIPKILKTDNGPAYASKTFTEFRATFQMTPITGIPYHPRGRGIIERAHGTLKAHTAKVKKGEYTCHSPSKILHLSLWTLNF